MRLLEENSHHTHIYAHTTHYLPPTHTTYPYTPHTHTHSQNIPHTHTHTHIHTNTPHTTHIWFKQRKPPDETK